MTLASILTSLTFAACSDSAADPGRLEPGQGVSSTPAIIEVAPAEAHIETAGESLNLTVELRDKKGKVVTGRLVTWTSLRPAVARVESSGRVTALAKGEAIVLASADGLVDTAHVFVKEDPPPAASIEILQGSASIPAIGGSITLAVEVRDETGEPVSSAAVSWESLNAEVATVSSAGKVFALATGVARIVARYGALSDTADVNVGTGSGPVQMDIVPQVASVALGGKTPLSVTLRDAQGGMLSASGITWESSDPVVASVSGTGVVTGHNPGIVQVLAHHGQLEASAVVQVGGAGQPAHVVIGTDADTIPSIGAVVTLTAVVYDVDGNEVPTAAIKWASLDPNVALVGAGTFAGVQKGVARVVARHGALADTAHLWVAPAPSTAIASSVLTSPAADTIKTIGGQVRLTGVVLDAQGQPIGGKNVSWTSLDLDIASVDAQGNVRALAKGTARIVGAHAAFADTSTVLVAPANTSTPGNGYVVELHPGSDTIPQVGGSLLFEVAIQDQNGNAVSGAKADWTVLDAGLLSLSETTQSKTSNATALGVGTTRVVAVYQGVADTATVTVKAAPVVNPADVRITPAADTIASVGATVQLAAVVLDDGGKIMAGKQISWSSLDPATASVSSTGKVTGVATGTARIRASHGTLADTAHVLVSQASFASKVRIAPSVDTIQSAGGTTTLTVTVEDAQGNPIPQPAAAWTSLDPSIATVSTGPASASRTVTGVSGGTARITATASGVTDTARVFVKAPAGPLTWTVGHSPSNPMTSGPVTISVNASNPSQIVRIKISVDGAVEKTCNGGTCTYAKLFTAGTYSYSASATDLAGKTLNAGSGSLTVAQASPSNATVPAELLPLIGPLMPRGSTQPMQSLDALFAGQELTNYQNFVKNPGTGTTVNHYGALRSRIQWAIRNGLAFGPGAEDPAQHVYGRGRQIVMHYLQNYSKPNNYGADAHHNTALADIEVLWRIEGVQEAWDHIWTAAHRSMSLPDYRFNLQVGDPRQVAVPLQAFNAAHRLGIPFKPSPFTSSSWNDHKATSWRDVGEKQITALLAGGSVHANGAVHSPAHSGSNQCGTAPVCEVYFMSAMLATEFLRWDAFVAPNQPAHDMGILIVDHLVSELARHGTACLPYLSSYVGKCDADLAAFFVWPALVAWQETGDDKYRTFALQNMKVAQKAWIVATKQFNQTFSTQVQTAEALLAGQPWR